jgi:hypothetical protein
MMNGGAGLVPTAIIGCLHRAAAKNGTAARTSTKFRKSHPNGHNLLPVTGFGCGTRWVTGLAETPLPNHLCKSYERLQPD